MHRNVPGVLATINAVFAEHKANVEAQLLGTRGEVGYVVTDIASAFTDEMISQLNGLPETIRLRILSSYALAPPPCAPLLVADVTGE